MNRLLPYNIQKAVIFPFSKEMHSLIRFEEYLNFEIIDVYDTKYSCLVGASTNHIMKIDNNRNHTIKNIDHIDWDTFDTIIVGHLEYLSDLFKYNDYERRFIEKICQNKKNIYSFDDLRNIGFTTSNNVFFPNR